MLCDPSDMPHLVDVIYPVEGTDAAGGDTVSYSTRQVSVPCLIRVASAQEQELYDRLGQTISHEVAMAYGGVRPGDVLVTQAGLKLKVKGAKNQPGVGSIPDLSYVTCEQIA